MENLEIELKNTVEQWLDRTFNFIQLEVFEKMAEGDLTDYIEPYNYMLHLEDYISSLDDEEMAEKELESLEYYGFDDEFLERYDNGELTEDEKEDVQENLKDFIKETCEDDVTEYVQNNGYDSNHYPTKSTLFELRQFSGFSEDQKEVIKNLRLGVISGLDPFSDTIFVMSSGLSLYGSYWIPLYLGFYPDEAEKFAGVKYNHL